MTPALWVTLSVGVMALTGAIAGVAGVLFNSQKTFRVRFEEVAEEQKQEAKKFAADERQQNFSEARLIREELKASRDELALDLVAEKKRLAESELFAKIERDQFRGEISELQGQQRKFDEERERNRVIVDALKVQHSVEVAKYKRELTVLKAKLSTMEMRIKELETQIPCH